MAVPGPKFYWRSLDQLEQTPEFNEFLQREFPQAASEFPQGLSRRRWLQLMGASLGLAGLAGCRWERDILAPDVQRPPNRIPGVPQFAATCFEYGGNVRPLVVTLYDGRPIKVEGNKEHPLSSGASDTISQAAILHMYDPDRSQSIVETAGTESFTRSKSDFDLAFGKILAAAKEAKGSGFAILAEGSTSPTRARLVKEFRSQYPEALFVEYEPVSYENVSSGAEIAFGQAVLPFYDFSSAKIVFSLDCDAFGHDRTAVANMRGWASMRVPESGEMNRTYAVESQFTSLGSVADHRLALKASAMAGFLFDLEAKIDRMLADGTASEAGQDPGQKLQLALAADLVQHRGASVITVGTHLGPEVHARACRLNEKLGNIGKTVRYIPASNIGGESQQEQLKRLISNLDRGAISTILVLGGNPVYNAPGDSNFESAYKKASTRIHLSDYVDETSLVSTWHVNRAHQFESWGDATTADGRLAIRQPLIEPIFAGQTDVGILAALVGQGDVPADQVVRATAQGIDSTLSDDRAWQKLLHDGFLVDQVVPAAQVAVKAGLELPPIVAVSGEDLEVVFTPHPALFDGRFANNGWLQELPDFLTKVTWDNVAILAPATADKLGVKTGSRISVSVNGRSVAAPVYVLPGQARNSIGLALGYGRTAAGHVGGLVPTGNSPKDTVEPVGFNAYPLRLSGLLNVAVGAKAEVLAGTYKLALTQDHHAIDTIGLEGIKGRIGELVREATLEDYKAHPDFAQHVVHHPPLESLWKERSSEGRAWGMSIDLSKCTGCNACLIACQSENNVPIVGKTEVARGREMHWIRLDRYFTGSIENPEIVGQPVNCMQCENAPCEQVCPVAATVHSPEGLNDMAYNRCIGTRYCGNNCPYKVRRFNFFDYNKKYEVAESNLSLMVLNPEVTVRERGVMEKCTYCTQRIQNGKIIAKNEQRPLADGEVVTACQQACPAGAIEFGDLMQTDSRVAKAHANTRTYGMLEELNNKPRTKYMAKIRNPHPSLNEGHGADHGGHGHHS